MGVVFTNAATAWTNATWSDPDKITVTQDGLGWDGDGAASRDGWIQTRPIAVGLWWRPTSAISVRAAIRPPPREFTLSNGQKWNGNPGNLFVRCSPDLEHWSSWQVLQGSEAQSLEEKKGPGRYYSGNFHVPERDKTEYNRLLEEYYRMDVPWRNDEEAAVKWILSRDPDFFAKQIPFIGYAEFLFEGEFRGGQRIKLLKVEISWIVSGITFHPKGEVDYKIPRGPWRYKSGNSSNAEPIEAIIGSSTNR